MYYLINANILSNPQRAKMKHLKYYIFYYLFDLDYLILNKKGKETKQTKNIDIKTMNMVGADISLGMLKISKKK